MFYLYLCNVTYVLNVHLLGDSTPLTLLIGVSVSYSRVLSWYLKSLCFEKCTQEEYVMTYKYKLGFTFTCGQCNKADYKSPLRKCDPFF